MIGGLSDRNREMDTPLALSLALIVGLAALLALRISANSAKRDVSMRRVSKRRAKKTGPFAAVSIVFDKEKACPEVMKLSGQRFLAGEAPKLPLRDCSVKRCSCSFHRYSDRRQKVIQRGVIEQPYSGPQQRGANRGRRADDMPSGSGPGGAGPGRVRRARSKNLFRLSRQDRLFLDLIGPDFITLSIRYSATGTEICHSEQSPYVMIVALPLR